MRASLTSDFHAADRPNRQKPGDSVRQADSADGADLDLRTVAAGAVVRSGLDDLADDRERRLERNLTLIRSVLYVELDVVRVARPTPEAVEAQLTVLVLDGVAAGRQVIAGRYGRHRAAALDATFARQVGERQELFDPGARGLLVDARGLVLQDVDRGVVLLVSRGDDLAALTQVPLREQGGQELELRFGDSFSSLELVGYRGPSHLT